MSNVFATWQEIVVNCEYASLGELAASCRDLCTIVHEEKRRRLLDLLRQVCVDEPVVFATLPDKIAAHESPIRSQDFRNMLVDAALDNFSALTEDEARWSADLRRPCPSFESFSWISPVMWRIARSRWTKHVTYYGLPLYYFWSMRYFNVNLHPKVIDFHALAAKLGFDMEPSRLFLMRNFAPEEKNKGIRFMQGILRAFKLKPNGIPSALSHCLIGGIAITEASGQRLSDEYIPLIPHGWKFGSEDEVVKPLIKIPFVWHEDPRSPLAVAFRNAISDFKLADSKGFLGKFLKEYDEFERVCRSKGHRMPHNALNLLTGAGFRLRGFAQLRTVEQPWIKAVILSNWRPLSSEKCEVSTPLITGDQLLVFGKTNKFGKAIVQLNVCLRQSFACTKRITADGTRYTQHSLNNMVIIATTLCEDHAVVELLNFLTEADLWFTQSREIGETIIQELTHPIKTLMARNSVHVNLVRICVKNMPSLIDSFFANGMLRKDEWRDVFWKEKFFLPFATLAWMDAMGCEIAPRKRKRE